jgi:hypothetical protein
VIHHCFTAALQPCGTFQSPKLAKVMHHCQYCQHCNPAVLRYCNPAPLHHCTTAFTLKVAALTKIPGVKVCYAIIFEKTQSKTYDTGYSLSRKFQPDEL